MKPFKRVLLICPLGCSVGPLFHALLTQAIEADPILSLARICVDNADISMPGEEEGGTDSQEYEMKLALTEMGFPNVKRFKNVDLCIEIVQAADLILVPRLSEEDLMCIFFPQSRSKVEEITSFCGNCETEKSLLSYTTVPQTMADYTSVAIRFKELLPDLVSRIKESYASTRIVKGIGMNRNTPSGNTVVAGRASVVRFGVDLMRFVSGNILVADRLNAILKSEIDQNLAESIIKKFAENPEFYADKVVEIEDITKDIQAKIEKKTPVPRKAKFYPDGENAIDVIVKNAKGLICSRGYHVNEIFVSHYNLPYISSCVEATNLISDGEDRLFKPLYQTTIADGHRLSTLADAGLVLVVGCTLPACSVYQNKLECTDPDQFSFLCDHIVESGIISRFLSSFNVSGNLKPTRGGAKSAI